MRKSTILIASLLALASAVPAMVEAKIKYTFSGTTKNGEYNGSFVLIRDDFIPADGVTVIGYSDFTSVASDDVSKDYNTIFYTHPFYQFDYMDTGEEGSSYFFAHGDTRTLGLHYAVLTGPQNSGTLNVENIGTGAVPEPATWALMIGGFGLVGAAARRRRIAVTA